MAGWRNIVSRYAAYKSFQMAVNRKQQVEPQFWLVFKSSLKPKLKESS